MKEKLKLFFALVYLFLAIPLYSRIVEQLSAQSDVRVMLGAVGVATWLVVTAMVTWHVVTVGVVWLDKKVNDKLN